MKEFRCIFICEYIGRFDNCIINRIFRNVVEVIESEWEREGKLLYFVIFVLGKKKLDIIYVSKSLL